MSCTYTLRPGCTQFEPLPDALSTQRVSFIRTIDQLHNGLDGRLSSQINNSGSELTSVDCQRVKKN